MIKKMNKTILLGRLVYDPNVSYTQTTNKMVVSFTLAVKRRLQEETDFFNIVAWNKTGEVVSKYFKKGRQVVVIGRLQNRQYEKDGSKRTVTEVIAEEVYFADSKKESNENNQNEEVEDTSFNPNFSLLDYDEDDLPF